MNWIKFDTAEGEGAYSGTWKILRRRGDNIFNVFHGNTLRALSFVDLDSAKTYVEGYWDAAKAPKNTDAPRH